MELKPEMDHFTWCVTRNALWKVASELDESVDPLLSDIIAPLLSALGHTIDDAPQYVDSMAGNWQKIEDAIWHDVWTSTKLNHPSRK